MEANVGWKPWIAFGAACVLFSSCSCWPDGPDTNGPTVGERAGGEDCPHTFLFANDDEAGVVSRLTSEAYAVPEYNDCQRFILRDQQEDRLVYGGRYAIFATQLAELSRRLDANTDGVVAAIVYAPDSIAYPPLGFSGRWNCLVIRGDVDDASADLEAAVVSVPSVGRCTDGLGFTDGLELAVSRSSPMLSEREDHYPAVARWGYDERSEVQYMIVKCGQATCAIGPRDFSARVTPDSLMLPGAPPQVARTFRIAGWHDEQPLAVVDETTGGLVPSDTWGIVIPHSGLGRLNAPEQFKDQWVLVASYAITSAAYRGKLALTPTKRGSALNEIYSCQGTCPGVPTSLGCQETDQKSTGQGQNWRTMFVSASKADTVFKCTRRYDQPNNAVPVPPTVRLRWRSDDEMTWYRCMSGCCDTEP